MASVPSKSPDSLKGYGSARDPEEISPEESYFGEDYEGYEDEGLGFEEGLDQYAPADVTRKQILELFHKVDALNREDEENLLEILRDALESEASGNDRASAEAYQTVTSTIDVEADDAD
ncbi:MAG: hypothetical protein ACREA0_31910, partial [bacterium]